jgi:phosphomannomutase
MRGLSEGGCRVLDYGLAATPMNYWAIVTSNAAGGVQVTASHNGPQYNGFKVSKEGAVPVDYAAGLDRVEAWVMNAEANGTPTTAATRAR